MEKVFLYLIRLGIGKSGAAIPKDIDWKAIEILAKKQGLLAVILDGIEQLPVEQRPPKDLLLQWIGSSLQSYEQRYELYCKAISSLAGFYNKHGFKMMVLKGYACALDWPKPKHRPCGDIDIWLFGKQKEADQCLTEEANSNGKKIKIDTSHHHHTMFEWQGFTVENHYDFINVHHHRSHRGLETIFKELGKECYTETTDATEKGEQHLSIELFGEKVYLPSPNLHALFLLRHALNHFVSIGINLRNVMDWAFFVEKHTKDINWKWLLAIIDEYHMRDFYNCINAICVEDLGFDAGLFPKVQYLPELKIRILSDIINPEFTIEEPEGFCRKWIHKYHRWKGNRWKQKFCYDESMWRMILSEGMVHFVKPKAN